MKLIKTILKLQITWWKKKFGMEACSAHFYTVKEFDIKKGQKYIIWFCGSTLHWYDVYIVNYVPTKNHTKKQEYLPLQFNKQMNTIILTICNFVVAFFFRENDQKECKMHLTLNLLLHYYFVVLFYWWRRFKLYLDFHKWRPSNFSNF